MTPVSYNYFQITYYLQPNNCLALYTLLDPDYLIHSPHLRERPESLRIVIRLGSVIETYWKNDQKHKYRVRQGACSQVGSSDS